MRTDDVNEIDESSLSGKFKAILGYALCLNQGISGRKRVRVEVLEAGPHSVKVADLIRCIKRSLRELATGSEMFRPWHDELPKPHIGSCLEALQAALIDGGRCRGWVLVNLFLDDPKCRTSRVVVVGDLKRCATVLNCRNEVRYMLIRIGYDIALGLPNPSTIVFLLRVHSSPESRLVGAENFQIEPELEVEEYLDAFGRRMNQWQSCLLR